MMMPFAAHWHAGTHRHLSTRNFREQCCDCGLIHRLDFRIVDGRIEFRTRRDDRATAAARRSFESSPRKREGLWPTGL